MDTDEQYLTKTKRKSEAREAMIGLCEFDRARASMICKLFDNNDYDVLDELMTTLVTEARYQFAIDIQKASMTGKGFKSINWHPWRFIKKVKAAREKMWRVDRAAYKWTRFHTGLKIDELLEGV
tara:strand:+ start:1557 stop:1928 length:372 start_codon:yes stop_codon:yes gene_type:complete